MGLMKTALSSQMQLLILFVEHSLVESMQTNFVDLVLLPMKLLILLLKVLLLFLHLMVELVLLDPTMETMVMNMKKPTLVTQQKKKNSGQKLRTEKTTLVLLFIILD